MRRILVVDDEPSMLNALQRSFRQIISSDEIRIEVHTSPLKALQRIVDTRFDLVIADYHMPEMDGISFLCQVKQTQPDAIRMMLSASSDFNTILGAINQAEALRFIPKPWEVEDLQSAYDLACQRYDQLLEERRLADERRLETGQLSEVDLELRRLEEQEPGITHVKWTEDGAVVLDLEPKS